MHSMMYQDQDKWRAMSRRVGEKMEAPPKIVRFSRKLLIVGALFLIVIGFFDVLK
jgi:hypothetical protein